VDVVIVVKVELEVVVVGVVVVSHEKWLRRVRITGLPDCRMTAFLA
jgi:hypothetical protein